MSVALLAMRPRHRPGGWTPKELSTLSLWLDADDATTVTLSTGVSQWDDKSGNARHVTQATGANQPAWVKGARNGRAAVRFDGTNDNLSAGDALDVLAGGLSVAAVGINTVGGTGDMVAKANSAGDSGGSWRLRQDRAVFFTTALRTASSTDTTDLAVVMLVLDRSASLAFRRNGTQAGIETTGFPNTTSFDNASSLIVGARHLGATANLNGDVCEVVASLATWTTGEWEKVEGYLAHKWGLAGSLPAGHPYLSAAP